MSILDLSKMLMYDFHYNYIKPKYRNNANLLFTDTDSLCYEIKTKDFYKDISGDVERWFDTSNYDKDHPSRIPTGKNKTHFRQTMAIKRIICEDGIHTVAIGHHDAE